MSGTGDRTAAGGYCPVHQVNRTRHPARHTWENLAPGHSVQQTPLPCAAVPSPPADPPGTEGIGYRGPTACAAAGITYRQLDYWARTGLVEPSIRSAQGSGTQRLYSFQDVLILKIVKRLLDAGIALQNIRVAVTHLRARTVPELSAITLMSDGATVYECTSAREVVDLLQGGQGVFGIAVGAVWRELRGALGRLHGERTDTGEAVPGQDPGDELARRRNRVG